jgi:hypothetical protein
LDLLKREAERASQNRLVHAKEEPPRADALADIYVDGVRDTTAATVGVHRFWRWLQPHFSSKL